MQKQDDHRGQAGGAADEGIVSGAATVAEQGGLQGVPIVARLLRIAHLRQELLRGRQATAWACPVSVFAKSLMSVSLRAAWTRHLNTWLKSPQLHAMCRSTQMLMSCQSSIVTCICHAARHPELGPVSMPCLSMAKTVSTGKGKYKLRAQAMGKPSD